MKMAARSAHVSLDDMPAIAALLDSDGTILAVNGHWRRFADENGCTGGTADPGCNYLGVCDNAQGPEAEEAAAAAAGIRAVLRGQQSLFALDYPCHSPVEDRWYKLLVGRTADMEGAIAVHVDITPEKLAQREVEQRRVEAERAIAARDRFLAAASHDLRQPLQAAELFLALLDREVAHTPAGDLVGHLSSALQALRQILDSLTDISRLEMGIQAVHVRRFEVSDVLEQVAAEAEVLAREKGLRLRWVGSTAGVTTDPELLARILRNLLCNAVRYTERGSILLGVRRRAGGAVDIVVADTGIGIDPVHQRAVFSEFMQVDNPERDRRKGLGLGLSIVRRLCDLLGLTVQLRSRPGRGTVVTVRIPPPHPAA